MRYRILGPLEVLSPDGWTAISAAKWRSLLACLLLRPGQLLPTESLIYELWGDNPPGTANNLVSIYIHRLKKVIGDTEGRMLVYRAPGYLLRVAPGDLDIQEFESLLAGGRAALAAADPERAAGLLGEALGLWRGRLLADVPQTSLIATHADRADELWLTTIELRVEADLACGRAVQVIPELHGLVREHPLRERLWASLIRALEEAGRRAEALERYAQARQLIADELGVDPGADLRRLYAELLAADTSPPSAAPPWPRPRATPVIPDMADAAAATVAPAVRSGTAAGPLGADDTTGGTGHEPGTEPPGSIAIGTFAEPALAAAAADLAEAGLALPGGIVGAPAGILRPAQLPADIGDFTGREAHVAHLRTLLLGGNAASSPGVVRIAVVNGAGGLGKTTLAVHAAHQVSSEFPDGQLYVDLLGASPQAATPGEVLARFLRDLGIEGDKIPARDDERATLYRSALTGRRVLVLLDNAKDAAQVRPLLPGSSSCAVLVTTRNRSSDLASMRFVDLDVLEDTEALALFSRIVGEERAAAEPDATAEVLIACAGLPLAIRICAARLAKRRQWRVATLAGRLRDQHRRLDELTTGDLAVRASFQVSYDSLRPTADGVDPARVFRLLGLWQGASISGAAAAALVGAPADDVAEALEALVDINLLESPAPDLYRFHDLLRVYAMERAQSEETQDAREEAVSRLLWWYLDTAQAAADAVSPRRYQVPREAADYTAPSAFASLDEALAWYDAERGNLVAAARQAADASLHEIAWRLPPTLFPAFNRRSNWADCVTANRVAVESARKAMDRPGEAWALSTLGFALARLRDPEAFGHLEKALALRQELGDTQGEVQTAIALGVGYLDMNGPGAAALESMRHAVDLLRPMGASQLLAIAVNNLGEVHYGLGDLDSAAECYRESCDIYREIGGYGLGHALHNLGRVYLALRRIDDANACFTEAVRAHQGSGDLVGEAIAIKNLGHVHASTGDVVAARAAWFAALAIFEQINESLEAADVIAALAALPAEDLQAKLDIPEFPSSC